MTRSSASTRGSKAVAPGWLQWLETLTAMAGLGVAAWAWLTSTGGVIHSHPAYLVLLVATAGVSLMACTVPLMRGRRPSKRGWPRAFRVCGAILAVAWVALMAWLRPFSAIEPALEAMRSDAAVSVTESATTITLTPAASTAGTGVLFHPGALVDPRAYAAVLRPLAEAGHTVIITKDPLGIAFLNTGALDDARGSHPDVAQWVAGGHSLGGVVASIEADRDDSLTAAPATGLLLFASYPAADLSRTLTASVESISGTEDGLSTPTAIQNSRGDLPAATDFTIIDGASHAQFGDYGPQPGDGVATITDDEARARISDAAVTFVNAQ
ncbi:alpha/beta hydrolase [Demequina globuliformis]|uniref:alpha/beta hydrolase n=1 Tax=Demequina globuliformis TaxID=676202 RepID=UPI00078140B5|nr:alpha/beta hydrolase [Demequina globuliformis]